MVTWYVYLIKRESGAIVYVGISKRPAIRHQQHKQRFGRKCIMEVLHCCKTKERATAIEGKLIPYYVEQKMPIRNIQCRSLDKKVALTIYIRSSVIDSYGGAKALKAFIEKKLENSAKLNLNKLKVA